MTSVPCSYQLNNYYHFHHLVQFFCLSCRRPASGSWKRRDGKIKMFAIIIISIHYIVLDSTLCYYRNHPFVTIILRSSPWKWGWIFKPWIDAAIRFLSSFFIHATAKFLKLCEVKRLVGMHVCTQWVYIDLILCVI